jgi:hypothetical protein
LTRAARAHLALDLAELVQKRGLEVVAGQLGVAPWRLERFYRGEISAGWCRWLGRRIPALTRGAWVYFVPPPSTSWDAPGGAA